MTASTRTAEADARLDQRVALAVGTILPRRHQCQVARRRVVPRWDLLESYIRRHPPLPRPSRPIHRTCELSRDPPSIGLPCPFPRVGIRAIADSRLSIETLSFVTRLASHHSLQTNVIRVLADNFSDASGRDREYPRPASNRPERWPQHSLIPTNWTFRLPNLAQRRDVTERCAGAPTRVISNSRALALNGQPFADSGSAHRPVKGNTVFLGRQTGGARSAPDPS
jgi:hypothetical protein